MSLRQLRRKATSGALLRALRSEIAHELSSPPTQLSLSQVGGFKVEWDDARTQDVFLKRRDEAEEIAVSGRVGALRFDEENSDVEADPNPKGDVLMKVCVKKAGFDPVMHFDCKVDERGFRINSAYYHRFVGDLGGNKYRGPPFCLFDPDLQKALEEYLVARGINNEFTDVFHQYVLKRERSQYVKWLCTLEGFFAKKTS